MDGADNPQIFYSPVCILLYFDFKMKFKLIMDFNMIYISANRFGGMMKKIWLSVLMGMMVFILNSGAFAADFVYTYNPNPSDLSDLDHYKAYSWEIDTSNIPDSETIIGASLFFDNIRNWTYEDNILYVSLLDASDIGSGVRTYQDNQAAGDYFSSSYFSGDSDSLFSLIDIYGSERYPSRTYDINVEITDNAQSGTIGTPNFSASTYYPATIDMDAGALGLLISYASDGIFGLGFDPDCHFYNDGITLKITTAITPPPGDAVPEPATLMLFGAGLLGLASRMRKKTNIA